MIISQNSKEVNDLAINIIIGFYWSGDAVQKDSRRTAKWLAIVRCLWQQGKKPVKMTVFPAIPSKRNEFAHVQTISQGTNRGSTS